MPNQTVKVYGADWCGDTRNTRAYLDEIGVEYQYLNVDNDPAAKNWMLKHNGGKQKLPTLDIQGRILSIPDQEELDSALREAGVV